MGAGIDPQPAGNYIGQIIRPVLLTLYDCVIKVMSVLSVGFELYIPVVAIVLNQNAVLQNKWRLLAGWINERRYKYIDAVIGSDVDIIPLGNRLAVDVDLESRGWSAH